MYTNLLFKEDKDEIGELIEKKFFEFLCKFEIKKTDEEYCMIRGHEIENKDEEYVKSLDSEVGVVEIEE